MTRSVRTSVLVVALVSLAGAVSRAAPRPPSDADTRRAQAAVYTHIIRTVCTARSLAGLTVYLGLDDSMKGRSPHPDVVRAVQDAVDVPVLGASALKSAIDYSYSDGIRNARTGRPGLEISMRGARWVARTRYDAPVMYGRGHGYLICTQYTAVRSGATFLVRPSGAGALSRNRVQRTHRGHRIVVQTASRAFDPRYHRITRTAERWLVDGRPALGTALGVPHFAEFRSFVVTVDGHRWPVPRKIWRDCFDGAPDAKGFSISRDGTQVTIAISGGDGAGSYHVKLRLRKGGRCTRTVSQDC